MNFKDMLTDDAGQYDLGFFLWAIGTLTFLVLASVNYAKFDAQQFGIGLGAVLASGGAMQWLRGKNDVKS